MTKEAGMKRYTPHEQRVRDELRKCGVTSYGMHKGETRRLPALIHEEEKIGGAIYGWCDSGSALLVATNRRVIFIDWKPMYTTTDEISYDVVAGVSYGHQSVVATVCLHTRIGDYTMRYVNLKSAKKFIHYLENRRLEGTKANGQSATKRPDPALPAYKSATLTTKEEKFLHENELATLSSLDRTGNVHGAAVYYWYDGKGSIFLLTKEQTGKAHDIFAHHQVALTVTNEHNLQTMQISALAEIESAASIKHKVFKEIVREREYAKGKHIPPVAKLDQGAFMVLRLTPRHVKFTDYSK